MDVTPELIDAGKRASDQINLHRTFMQWDELKTKWIAFNLSDGSSDGILYDNKRDAIKHQVHEFQCAYVCFKNLIQGSTPKEMAIFIQFSRDAYKAGFRLPDPDDVTGGPDVLMTAAQTDYYRQAMRDSFARRLLAHIK